MIKPSRLGAVAICSGTLALATGCPGPTVATPKDLPGTHSTPRGPSLPGTATPGIATPAPTNLQSLVPATQPTALNGGTIRIVAKDPGGAPIAGAHVTVIGPNLAFGNADGKGVINVGPLALGTYEIRVEAGGRLAWVGTASLGEPRANSTQDAPLPLAPRTLTGRVLGASNDPLAGARVVHGNQWTLTDAAGGYSLPVSAEGTATIRKTGYAQATSNGGDLALAPSVKRISFDSAPFGQAASSALAAVRSDLAAAGWTVGDADEGAEVRVWAAPSTVSDQDLATVVAHVKGGGKLVVLGDWGGASNYRPDAANKLLLPLGIALGIDLVRATDSSQGKPEWLAAAPTAAIGGSALTLLGAASVRSAAPGIALATAPQGGFTVQALDAKWVGVARPIGLGLVVALGDTSAWLDADIGRGGNRGFIQKILEY